MFEIKGKPSNPTGFEDIRLEMDCIEILSNERRPSFLRSDSDSNTFYTFSTLTTLCSESERNNEVPGGKS